MSTHQENYDKLVDARRLIDEVSDSLPVGAEGAEFKYFEDVRSVLNRAHYEVLGACSSLRSRFNLTPGGKFHAS